MIHYFHIYIIVIIVPCIADVDECKSLRANCQGRRCQNTVGSYYCTKCPKGYSEGRGGACIGQCIIQCRSESCVKSRANSNFAFALVLINSAI